MNAEKLLEGVQLYVVKIAFLASLFMKRIYLLLILLSVTQCNILVPVDTIELLVSPNVARM